MTNSQDRPIQVLVIDDDRDLLATVELQLMIRDHQVLVADSGARGIEVAISARPDVILLDIGLPDMDGHQVAHVLRQDFRTAGAGIIMLTARSDQGSLRCAVGAGADDYMIKPYDLDELCSRIEMVLLRSARNLERSPLTGLPGNNLIRAALRERIEAGLPFALGYVDVDRFKAINDHYGPARGDRVIHMLASTLVEEIGQDGSPDDFLGHIGGDDFVFLAVPERVTEFCARLFDCFDERVRKLYEPEDLDRGGIEAEDRRGVVRMHPVATLSIGVVNSSRDQRFQEVQRVFELATEAKHEAKRKTGNCCVVWGPELRGHMPAPAAPGGPEAGEEIKSDGAAAAAF